MPCTWLCVALLRRQGYDESLGQILHVKESVNTFITAADPVRVLSTVNQLVWDEESEKFKTHKATTPEVLACCDDLRVRGAGCFTRPVRVGGRTSRSR